MKLLLLQLLASPLITVMSFLGWGSDEVPVQKPVPKEVVAPITTTTPTQKSITPTTTKKKVAPVVKPKATVAKKKPAVVAPVKQKQATKTQVPAKTTPLVINGPSLNAEERVRQSTVNIYCSRIFGNKIQRTTGSGVLIDSSGVILTNSHVAEYFLLAQNGNNTTCSVRIGSPASNAFKAKLVYLPSVWINNNKNNLSMSTLTGTGENDYALLVITEKITKLSESTPLSYLDTSNTEMAIGSSLILAGYPAGFSNVSLLTNALYLLIKYSSVVNVASFSGRSIDVINTGPTVIAEHGSSGGAVTDSNGVLQALIVATNIDPYSGEKNIQAITLPYIKQSIQNNSGKSFEYLVSNARDEANNFEKNSVSNLAGVLLNN